MYRLQGSKTSSDFRTTNNKNKTLSPNNNLSKTINNPFRNIRMYNSPSPNESSKESTFYRLNQVPPIYFYRKINNPYKYNISSVPEYLIKTDEEKHFMEKLYQTISNEKDKKILTSLIHKNNQKDSKHRDFYKPKYFNVQKILKYKPELFNESFKFERRSKSIVPKDNLSFRSPQIHKLNRIIETNEDLTNENNNKSTNINNENELKNNDIKNPIKNISKADQIRYKYSLSDIFNIRNEKVFINKSAEKYLLREKENLENLNKNPQNIFNSASESKSDWIAKPLSIKMNTYSSVNYNILSPLCKDAKKFISASEFNKNNRYNESPAYHRMKSISEFIDLTRVSAGNSLKCFNKKLSDKIPDFRVRDSIAANQLDAYHINKDLIPKPI